MADIIRNRNRDWERKDLQRRLLGEVQAVYKIKDMLDQPDLFITMTDFILDQFPVGEKDVEGKGTEAWWNASFAFENGIAGYSLDEFCRLATRPLKMKEEEDT